MSLNTFLCFIQAWAINFCSLEILSPHMEEEQSLNLFTDTQTQPSRFREYSFTNTSKSIKIGMQMNSFFKNTDLDHF